ncbi:hypothetical protein CVT25_007841, partial [Psilocybe cyanescens]
WTTGTSPAQYYCIETICSPCVDSYHYINHQSDDYLCQKYCNPAPQDGSAQNLVHIGVDANESPFAQQAFNTQVCEQLNSWLGEFQSIAKCMTPGNFNWFIHAMLFYHTKYVLRKWERNKMVKESEEDEAEDLGIDEEIEEDDD